MPIPPEFLTWLLRITVWWDTEVSYPSAMLGWRNENYCLHWHLSDLPWKTGLRNSSYQPALNFPFSPFPTFSPCEELCLFSQAWFCPQYKPRWGIKGLGELAMYNRHSVHFFVVRILCARDCSTCCTLLKYMIFSPFVVQLQRQTSNY